jgi:tetratricopeptide (TPR) repeat protein
VTTLSAEDKELKKISTDFGKAVQAFQKKDYQGALDMLNSIIDSFKDSEYDSVLEIQGQSKIYQNICHSRLNPVKVVLKSDEEYLNEGLFKLNSGNPDQALKHLRDLEEKKGYSDPYLFYLLALVYIKKEDYKTGLEYLKKCVSKDDFYKVIAHNEPDFEPLKDNGEFLSLVG